MALKASLTKVEHDALAEPLKEHYKASGESFILDAEGVEDVSGLKSALEKEKKERRELKAIVEKNKDIDPDKAREAIRKLAELDEKSLIDKGEFDRLLAKRAKEFDEREAERQRLLDDATRRLDTYELINPVRDAALKAGVLPTDIDIVLSYTNSRFKLDEKRKPVVLDKDGDVATISVEDFWAKEFKEAHPKFYAASGAGGSGSPANNGGGGGGGKKTITRSQWAALPPAEQAVAFKDGAVMVDG